MLFIEDFTEAQSKWFREDFAQGKRHMEEEGFTDFLNVTSVVPVLTDEGPQMISVFSYSISRGDALLYGVIPKEGDRTVGVINVFDKELEIPFFSDSLADNLREIFGPYVIGIVTVLLRGRCDAVVLNSDDIAEVFNTSPQKVHQQVMMAGMKKLMSRA